MQADNYGVTGILGRQRFQTADQRSRAYPRFFRFSAQRFFIASDNRLLPAGVIPPRLARMAVRFFLIDLILARSAIA
jgi:hypothetical protein